MEKKLHKIQILPAKFIEKRGDKYVVRCMIDFDCTEDMIFEEFSLQGMVNPKYLLIGNMTGVGFTQITFTDARKFEKYFKTKWKILVV